MDHDLQHMCSETTLATVFHIESIRTLISDVLDHKINTSLRY